MTGAKSPGSDVGGVVSKVTELIRLRIARATGRAMAAVLLGKDEAQVTDAEAMAAHVDHIHEYDEDKQDRVIRAGWRAAARTLDAEGLLPGILGAHLTLALSDLDKGKVRGMAKPPPKLRRSENALARMDAARDLAFYVHWAMGRYNISKSHALVAVTGLPEGAEGREYAKVMEPKMALAGPQTYDALIKQLAKGERYWGKAALPKLREMGAAKRMNASDTP